MDLLSSIRKSGSRGGQNFSWDEVQTSQHRENYLGHSLMAPVGRWQKGRDLNWYAKGDDQAGVDGETIEQKRARERKEEIRKIKEAEEDALARALGLPVTERNQTGANAISVGEMKRVIKEAEEGGQEIEQAGRGKGFGDFVGKIGDDEQALMGGSTELGKGGLLTKDLDHESGGRRRDSGTERRHQRHRHRSRSGERVRKRYRSRSGERHTHRLRHDGRRDVSRSPRRSERRYRSRSGDRRKTRPDDRESRRDDRDRRRDFDRKPRRSRSPSFREGRGRRD